MELELINIQIPLDPQNLDGDFIAAMARIINQHEGYGVAEIEELEEGKVDWVEEFNHVYFQTMGDGVTLKAIRKATDEDIKKYRVPIWIQGEEVPFCCDRSMIFVAQLDDDNICTEPPPNAELWWHDAASFYVFTCPFCLGVQAVGQQF